MQDAPRVRLVHFITLCHCSLFKAQMCFSLLLMRAREGEWRKSGPAVSQNDVANMITISKAQVYIKTQPRGLLYKKKKTTASLSSVQRKEKSKTIAKNRNLQLQHQHELVAPAFRK